MSSTGPLRPTRRSAAKEETEPTPAKAISPTTRRRPPRPAIRPFSLVPKSFSSAKKEDEGKSKEDEPGKDDENDDEDADTDSTESSGGEENGPEKDQNVDGDDSEPESFQLWGLVVRDGDSRFPVVVSAYADKESALLNLLEGTFQHALAFDDGKRFFKLSVSPFWTEKDVGASELHDMVQETSAASFTVADVPPRVWKMFCSNAQDTMELKMSKLSFAKFCGCYVEA
jgi:hypothetical protein